MTQAVLTNLLNYLQGTLSPSNMRWIGEHLIECADKEESLKPYTMEEIDEMLIAAENDFANQLNFSCAKLQTNITLINR